MKNIFRFFIILFLFLQIIFCQNNKESICLGSSSSVDGCKTLLNDEEKLNNDHCCLFSGNNRGSLESQCTLVDEFEYENIDLKKSEYTDKGYTDVDIDCKSYYYSLNIAFCFLFILI